MSAGGERAAGPGARSPADGSCAPTVVAYIPVLHDGYQRFLERHCTDRPLYLIGPELYADYRPLAKDIRALAPRLMARAIAGLGIASSVDLLDAASAAALAARKPSLVMPSEDVSFQVAERWFERCEVSYDTVFLRWDRVRSAQLLEVRPERVVDVEGLGDEFAGVSEAGAPAGAPATETELAGLAHVAAARSIDWWRQVGAAVKLADGQLLYATNTHTPYAASPYVVGDPRANFYQGVHLELSTAEHAEAHLVAEAARRGLVLAGAVVYVTDFPCPPCARLLAGAGVARLYFERGYAVLDGRDVLEAAGVEIVQVKAPESVASDGESEA